ncbi:hypothetical protein K376_05984 [Streptomyces sp. PsTaAH-130]|nr:hypothetical protein K376_05984 [Streptomyces sp. PsTaAH-130]
MPVALAPAVQLGYLLLTVPLSVNRLLLTLKLCRLIASQQTLRQNRGNKRARDAHHRSG